MYNVISDGRRIDILLSEMCGLTRSRVSALIEEGNCTAGGKICTKPGTKPTPGVEVTLTVPQPADPVPQPENIPLNIIYEDSDIALVEKPSGMVVHPASGNETGTLVNALLFCLTDLSGIGGVARPGIVHRLDKDTSGLLLVAKNDAAHISLSSQLSERKMEKHYMALVEGKMKEDSGRIDSPIGRSKNDRKKMAVDPEGRESVTEWKKICDGKNTTLLDVHILTGRTHQIRVHMQSIGHPICGDAIYGRKNGAKVPRLMLHSFSLRFTHPSTGEEMRFTCPPPEEFVKGLKTEGIDPEIINKIFAKI